MENDVGLESGNYMANVTPISAAPIPAATGSTVAGGGGLEMLSGVASGVSAGANIIGAIANIYYAGKQLDEAKKQREQQNRQFERAFNRQNYEADRAYKANRADTAFAQSDIIARNKAQAEATRYAKEQDKIARKQQILGGITSMLNQSPALRQQLVNYWR